MNSFPEIKTLTKYFTKEWSDCDTSFPDWNNSYSSIEKRSREKYFEKFVESLNKRSNKKNTNSKPSEKLTPVARMLFKTVFDYRDDQLDIILSDEYKQMTKDFIRMGKRFDPEIDLDDVFQACRNAWIMNGIQVMLGHQVVLTPSIFAYSMLYPYTDNYLDDPDITQKGKIEFSRRFRKRLNGEKVNPLNNNEELIFKLIEMIEDQYNRFEYPKVYSSLLAIHDAQTKSLSLLDKNVNLSKSEVLKICIEKGGTSVLADGYLVAGDLTEDQVKFFFGFGAYLQLVDDIQDVREDSCAGQLTVFSQASLEERLDSYTSKTFLFGNKIFDLMDSFKVDILPVFKSLMRKSVEIMLVETILLNDNYYSQKFTNKIEDYSPLSVEYLKKRRSKLSPNRISYMKRIVESTVSNL